MSPDHQHSENARQILHMSMGAFALLLRWLTWGQAMALAGFALAFNFLILPSVAGRLYRPSDLPRRLHGIVFYPLAVLLLLILFPHRLDIVAGAWGILAMGDGLATLVGRAAGGRRWPWNPDKTVAGSVAFFLAGGSAATFLTWWCRSVQAPEVSLPILIGIAVTAALVAALVETIPVRLDDNLSVAMAAGVTLWLGSMVDVTRLPSAWHLLESRWMMALAANLAVAIAGHRARTVSRSGAIVGAIIGTIIYASLGWQGWLLLLLTFVAASVSSRLGLRRKVLLGIAEERGGRRGAGNAIANTGVAAICALLLPITPFADAARLAFVAALAAAGSDTIASEIGKAWGRRTWSITSLTQVPPGTSGAMSVEGTIAGAIGALGLAMAAVVLDLTPARTVVFIAIAASIGSLLESWLGATLEGPGILNNDMLNFINTATAGVVAILIA
jgi:uncharacterized protein (TIGR00297 family)